MPCPSMPATLPDSPIGPIDQDWGQELGFAHVGIAGVDLGEHEQHLQRWLAPATRAKWNTWAPTAASARTPPS
jgi:epoxyqueuosine reductase QueG